MTKFNYKKRLGQNFIKDPAIVKKIVEMAEIENDSLIIEVGPGKGILTEELSKTNNNVISYEIDLELKDYLLNKFEQKSNVKFIFEDFMIKDIIEDIKEYKYNKIYFIANVPYYITTPIIMKLIELPIKVDKIVVMIQKEVAERYAAKNSTKEYSSISVFLNYYYDIKKLFKVTKEKFVPQPKVDSEVISLTRKEKLLPVDDYNLFHQLIRDSFQFKRKTIKNNLRKYNLVIIEEVLKEKGYSLSSRAEELDVEIFVEISNALNKSYKES